MTRRSQARAGAGWPVDWLVGHSTKGAPRHAGTEHPAALRKQTASEGLEQAAAE